MFNTRIFCTKIHILNASNKRPIVLSGPLCPSPHPLYSQIFQHWEVLERPGCDIVQIHKTSDFSAKKIIIKRLSAGTRNVDLSDTGCAGGGAYSAA